MDRLVTVFVTTGAQELLGSLSKLSTAQERYADAVARFKGSTNSKEIQQAYNQARGAAREVINEQLQGAVKLTAAFTLVAVAIRQMTSDYANFGTKVMNLSQLTGSSLQTSARALVLGRIGGLDSSIVRDLAKPSRAIFSDQGRAGLSKLGILPNPNQSGLEVFDQVAERLSTMQDGLRKTQIMNEIFGEKGAESMLPLLRMTQEQRRAVRELSDSYDTGASQAIQSFTFASAILGETLLQRVIYPIAQQLLPVLQRGAELLTLFANWWGNLNDILGGVPNWAVAMIAFGGSIALVVGIVGKLTAAFKIAREAALALGLAQAVGQFMAGDLSALGRIAIGGAVLGAGVYGFNAVLNSASSATKAQMDAAEKMDQAADKFITGVNRMGDSLDKIRGKNIPSGTSYQGIGRLASEMKLDSIG